MIKLLMKLRNRKGFTLIELIVVIAILGILAAILIPQFSGFQQKAKSSQVMVNAKQIATAADALLVEKGSVPDATEIVKVAGSDIIATHITGISTPAADADGSGHVLFTYVLKIDEVTYTATRAVNADGEVTLTVSY